tara:strand:- start:368 stop:652 length:285 start_codon:yes stop_codon:yes gene_type:complete
MHKLISILFITSLISFSHASYLDDWSNDNLCGWMESTSIPNYILEEVDKRKILCSGGLEVSVLNSSSPNDSINGTIFASPDQSLIIELKSKYTY